MSTNEPRIVERGPFLAMGIEDDFSIPPAQSQMNDIWTNFFNKYNHDQNEQKIFYGICEQTPQQFKDNIMTYSACVGIESESELSAGMVIKRVSGGKYALYTHYGLTDKVLQSYQTVVDWIDASPYEFDPREVYEVYDERYKHEDPQSAFDILMPIK